MAGTELSQEIQNDLIMIEGHCQEIITTVLAFREKLIAGGLFGTLIRYSSREKSKTVQRLIVCFLNLNVELRRIADSDLPKDVESRMAISVRRAIKAIRYDGPELFAEDPVIFNFRIIEIQESLLRRAFGADDALSM